MPRPNPKTKTGSRRLNPRAQRALDLISDEEDRRITEAAESDPDSRILDEEWFKKARPAAKVVPGLVEDYRRRVRGKQKAPTKERVTLRLDPEIVDHFRAGGKGWQSRINETLRKALKLDRQAS